MNVDLFLKKIIHVHVYQTVNAVLQNTRKIPYNQQFEPVMKFFKYCYVYYR